jgi:hypothetical protein
MSDKFKADTENNERYKLKIINKQKKLQQKQATQGLHGGGGGEWIR